MDRELLSGKDVELLLTRAKAGSQEAIEHLVNCFSPSVYRSIRRALARSVRRTADSDDIAQSVWKSFFALGDRFCAMESPAQLRKFLSRMAANKTIDRGRRFYAQQRRKEKLIVAGLCESLDPARVCRGAASPSEELIAKESYERIVSSVPPRFLEVIKKRAEGATISEISEELNIPLRSLHRILHNARLRAYE